MTIVRNYSDFKALALSLRKQGLSYNEILKQVPVAKSTMSLWLRSIGLSKRQKQRLTEKKLQGMKRAWENIRFRRIEKTKRIKKVARIEARNLMHDQLWLIGLILYWAEGSKEKKWRTGTNVIITNMDPNIIKIMVTWFKNYLGIDKDGLEYSLYIHKGAPIEKSQKFWADSLFILPIQIKTYFKPDYGKNFRKNTEDDYNGIFRVKVYKSTDLNRKIAGWIEGVIDYLQ